MTTLSVPPALQRLWPLVLAVVVFWPGVIIKGSALQGPIPDGAFFAALPVVAYLLPLYAVYKFFSRDYNQLFGAADRRNIRILAIGMAALTAVWAVLAIWSVPMPLGVYLQCIAGYVVAFAALWSVTGEIQSSRQLSWLVGVDLFVPLCIGMCLMLGSAALKGAYVLNGFALYFVLRAAAHALARMPSAQ